MTLPISDLSNNLNFLFKEEYLNNYKNKTPFKFNEKMPIDISWDELLKLVDSDLKQAIEKKENFSIDLWFKIKMADRIDTISKVIEKILEKFEMSKFWKNVKPSPGQHIYISFTSDELVNQGMHSDKDNVFFWQLQGKCIWRIYDEFNQFVKYEFELAPGDIIYCPKYRQHLVVSLTPRAGASLGFGSLK
jgi:hypothetical protein